MNNPMMTSPTTASTDTAMRAFRVSGTISPKPVVVIVDVLRYSIRQK